MDRPIGVRKGTGDENFSFASCHPGLVLRSPAQLLWLSGPAARTMGPDAVAARAGAVYPMQVIVNGVAMVGSLVFQKASACKQLQAGRPLSGR